MVILVKNIEYKVWSNALKMAISSKYSLARWVLNHTLIEVSILSLFRVLLVIDTINIRASTICAAVQNYNA